MDRIPVPLTSMSVRSLSRRQYSLILVALSSLLLCITTSSAQTATSSSGQRTTTPSATEVFQSAINALSNVQTVECEVRQIPTSKNADGAGVLTRVIAAFTAPKRYWVRLHGADPPRTELAVWNGKVSRTSMDGKVEEFPAMGGHGSAPGMGAATLSLFDPDTYRQALAGNRMLYAGQDDVEGDLCNVVAVIRPTLSVIEGKWVEDSAGSNTTYYWISARTGLPHSEQAYRINKGSTLLTSRLVWSSIRMNPAVSADLFEYLPSAADSTSAQPAIPTVASTEKSAGNLVAVTSIQPIAAMTGKQVPDLEVRDLEYKPASLASLIKGKATLISLWATWCGPCQHELPVFQELQKRYAGRLQIVTILVQDSRLNLLAWMKRYPQYNFVWMMDPDGSESGSKIWSFFVGTGGPPRNALIDAQGTIIDYWEGYGGNENELIQKIDKLMGSRKTGK